MKKSDFMFGGEIIEVVSPSDPYTLRSNNPYASALAIALLTQGKWGVRGSEFTSPVFFGWDEFIQEHIGDVDAYIDEHHLEIIESLSSLVIGKDRLQAEAEIKATKAFDFEQWFLDRHDMIRTSMTDLLPAAQTYVAKLKKHYSVP